MKFKVLLLSLVFIFTGCAPLIWDSMLDSMADFTERMNKIEMDRIKLLKEQSFSIEGEIAKTEMVEKEFEKKSWKSQQKTDDQKTGFEVKEVVEIVKRKVFIIYFTDGREKELSVPDKPLLVGKYYFINYNGLQEIISIEERTQ